jgi:hypothetical protein
MRVEGVLRNAFRAALARTDERGVPRSRSRPARSPARVRDPKRFAVAGRDARECR